jgi:hypothetical protein
MVAPSDTRKSRIAAAVPEAASPPAMMVSLSAVNVTDDTLPVGQDRVRIVPEAFDTSLRPSVGACCRCWRRMRHARWRAATSCRGVGPSTLARGYVFADEQPNTVPLKLYWSEARGDNFTTATQNCLS